MRKLCAALALTLTACGEAPTAPAPLPTQPVNVTVIVNQNQGGNPSPAPGAPGATVAPPNSVKIGGYGEDCPSGVSPSGMDRGVRRGCTKAITCTPRKLDGTDLWAGVAEGSIIDPTFYGVVSGYSLVRISGGENGYNLRATGVSRGQVTLLCTVLGVNSDPWVLEVVD